MAQENRLDAGEILERVKNARTISIAGLITAFLASAVSVLTGSMVPDAEGRVMFTITVLLWFLAVAGMVLWLYGRRAMRRAAATGGWLAQTIHADALDEQWNCTLVVFDDHTRAEEVFGECVRRLRSAGVTSPVRLDLSWLKDEDDSLEFVIAAFTSPAESWIDSFIEECFKEDQVSSVYRVKRGSEVREEYFRRLGGCGASMWIE